MKEEASADDFQVQNFLKRKKKKKNKEYSQRHEDDDRESIENAELSCASPVLFEDRVAQSGKGCKKKKKKKDKGEKEQSALDNSRVGLKHEISSETEVDASPLKKKKKKKKQKYDDGADDQSDVTCVSQHSTGSCPEIDVDYVNLKQSVKKKRKEKLPEEDEVHELSTLETYDENDHERSKKKKKRDSSASAVQDTDMTVDQSLKKRKKKRDSITSDVQEDTEMTVDQSLKKKKKKRDSSTPDMQEDTDVTVDQSLKKKKKKRDSGTPDMQEDTDMTVDQSLLSPPEQNRQRESKVSPLPKGKGGVATRQKQHKDGKRGASPAMSEDSTDVPADSSKPTKAADQSPRISSVHPRKRVKSRAFITEENSSDSDVVTPEPVASNRKKDQNSSVTEMVASDELRPDYENCLGFISSFIDLDTAKKELEEFIPHARNISDSSIKKMAGRDLMRFKQFKKQGVSVRFGRFSQRENDQIRKNVEEFLSITGIDSAEKLLFTSRYPEEKETINRLKTNHLFCEKLSEGIPRPWRLIYYRARKMFDSNNYKGRYTKEEKEKLKKYHALHGNDWKKISEMMSRSNLSVAMKYSEIKSDINYGPWSKEETQKLMQAVEEVIRKRIEMEDAESLSSSAKSRRDLLIDREKLCQKLPWTEIEAKVGTRYWRQCKQKWTTILTKKMTKGQQLYRGTKALEAKINLIRRLHEMELEDSNEVNWEELRHIIGDVPIAYVQAKFYKLKVTCVPFWRKKSFSEIIDYLFEKKLPELEKKLGKRKGKRLSPSTTTEQKSFRLSEIFDTSEDSD